MEKRGGMCKREKNVGGREEEADKGGNKNMGEEESRGGKYGVK